MSRAEEFQGGVRPATELKQPGLGWKKDEYGDDQLVNTAGRRAHRGPVMSEDEARAKGWEGPLYHGTSTRRGRSIEREGFRQPRLANWDLGSAGTQEETVAGRTHETWLSPDLEGAKTYATYGGDRNGSVIKAYVNPEHMSRQFAAFAGTPAVVVHDVRHVAVVGRIKVRKGKQ